MGKTENAIGDAKLQPPPAAKPMNLSEALEFLRSAMQFVAIAGVEPDIENTPGGLVVSIPAAMFVADDSGDIYFVPISPQLENIATGELK